MVDSAKQADWEYRTLLIIWAGLSEIPLTFLLVLYLTQAEIFVFDLSAPFVGDRYILIPFAVLLSVFDLCLAYRQHKRYLRQAIVDKDPELVRKALIFAGAKTVGLGVYGFFLAWIFDYPYFIFWIIVSFVATLCYFPRRSCLAAARELT